MNLISTLGWSADVVLHPARVLNPERMVVFYGPETNAEVMAAVQRVKEEYPDTKFVQVNPFSLSDCIAKMHPHIGDDAVVNMTGGTKIMAFTLALLATYREGGEVPVIYVQTRDGGMSIIRIPLRLSSFTLNFKKNSTKRLILEILCDEDDCSRKLSGPEIRKIMAEKYGHSVSESTFNSAKEELKRLNIIVEEKKGRKLYFSARAAAAFFIGGD